MRKAQTHGLGAIHQGQEKAESTTSWSELVKSAGEAPPPGIAKYGAIRESELAVLQELSERFERKFGYTVDFLREFSMR